MLSDFFAFENEAQMYHSNQEFLKDILVFWDMLLSMLSDIRRYNDESDKKLAVKGLYPETDSPHLLFCTDYDKSLEISDNMAEAVENADEYICNRAELSEKFLPLFSLRENMDLTSVEYIALLAAFAYDYDVRYSKLYASLQDGIDVPTVGLCCAAASLFKEENFEKNADNFISGTSRIFPLFFLQGEKEETVGRIRRPVFLKERTFCFLLDENKAVSKEISSFCHLSFRESLRESVIHQEIIRQMLQLISFRENLCMILCGDAGSGKQTAVKMTALNLSYNVLFLHIRSAMRSQFNLEQLAFRICAELLFTESLLCLVNDKTEESPETDQFVLELLPNITKYFPLVFLTTEEVSTAFKHLQYPKAILEIPVLTTKEKILVWNSAKISPQTEDNFSLEKTLSHYVLNMDEINRIAISSGHYAILNERNFVSEADIIQAIKTETARDFGGIAEPIPTVFRMKDILLSEEQKALFWHIADIYMNQNSVYEEWNLKKKYPYGNGFCILFYGSPGTGKTMGAQVLANMLEFPLYRVDLSQIVSKYIGETEKNITRLFEYAKNVNCVLFFDEADSLFSKRSVVKDSHDKNANATTAHLLQKIESFSGVAILATNYIQNIDDAFRRRIRFSVNFGFPSQEEREQLWEKILPEPAYRQNINIPYLAQMFELTGSNIKEIVANACCMAYADGSLLTMKYLSTAIRMNYAKHNKTLPVIPYK